MGAMKLPPVPSSTKNILQSSGEELAEEMLWLLTVVKVLTPAQFQGDLSGKKNGI